MRAIVHAGVVEGVSAIPVLVEAQVGKGLPGIDVVGMPERGVRESRVRVKAALHASGFELPPRYIALNLAPADLRKWGASFDLAIALSVLACCELVPAERLVDTLVLGELSLGGGLRPTRGVLPQLRAARAHGLTRAIIPKANEREGALMSGLDIRCAFDLREVVEHLEGFSELSSPPPSSNVVELRRGPCLSDIRGQPNARRALEIAAAGEHHMLMVGPPGAGKTMLARRLPGLLPPPSDDEALEIATIGSAAGTAPPLSLHAVTRPLRAPHHTASCAALVGGGDPVRPGEVTLAHRGVLFLDELPEFPRDAIESLRITMEEGNAVIVRARERVCMPARSLVVAAMNPCPCGYAGVRGALCRCAPQMVMRYQARVSGPLLDRFDLHVMVPRLDTRRLHSLERSETTETVRIRVARARARAPLRSRVPKTDELLALTALSARNTLDGATDHLGLSARGYVKVLRVAETIARLADRERIEEDDVIEALGYRSPLFDSGRLRGDRSNGSAASLLIDGPGASNP